MTDINAWDKLIGYGIAPDKTRYIMIPVSEYQLANLVGLLQRNHNMNNGDWFYEWLDIIATTVRILNIQLLTNNFGDNIDPEQIYQKIIDEHKSKRKSVK